MRKTGRMIELCGLSVLCRVCVDGQKYELFVSELDTFMDCFCSWTLHAIFEGEKKTLFSRFPGIVDHSPYC